MLRALALPQSGDQKIYKPHSRPSPIRKWPSRADGYTHEEPWPVSSLLKVVTRQYLLIGIHRDSRIDLEVKLLQAC